MITGGSFRNEKFILAAESDADASMIKRGLCGKSEHMSVAPYGNKVNISLQGNTIVFKKHSGLPLTYEETYTVIRKICLFGKIMDKTTHYLHREARMHLPAGLTLFYPNTTLPAIQIIFSYNWVTFETERKDFAQSLPAIHDAVLVGQKDNKLKVFSNDSTVISIHNYQMGGIYIGRACLGAIADALIQRGLTRSDEKDTFVIRTAAFGVKSSIYMDARQLCQNVDETFDITANTNYNPLIGQQSFLTPILGSFGFLAETGSFSDLSQDQVEMLRAILLKPESLKQYGLSETISMCLTAFTRDFGDEIGKAYAAMR